MKCSAEAWKKTLHLHFMVSLFLMRDRKIRLISFAISQFTFENTDGRREGYQFVGSCM